MKVLCITQARMSSTRLPGKVLKEIAGIPLLGYHMARVAKSQRIDKHLIAISQDSADDALADYLTQQHQTFFRGSEQDVLERFYQAAVKAEAEPDDLIIRLTGDCPLICPKLLDKVIDTHLRCNNKGYSHLDLAEFPRGFDTEVFSMRLLTQAWMLANTAAEREHVTMYLYKHDLFKLYPVGGGAAAWNQLRLCVDQIEDFDLIQQIVTAFGAHIMTADGPAICQWLLERPKIAAINQLVQQKTSH
jgi:spore coat polysaccharide biosynthesis protein SpsF